MLGFCLQLAAVWSCWGLLWHSISALNNISLSVRCSLAARLLGAPSSLCPSSSSTDAIAHGLCSASATCPSAPGAVVHSGLSSDLHRPGLALLAMCRLGALLWAAVHVGNGQLTPSSITHSTRGPVAFSDLPCLPAGFFCSPLESNANRIAGQT